MKYSIIIPIYNTEKYLKRCIDSVLNQTFNDFELVLVNDGSKDNSIQICEDYKKLDNRVVIINKENGGVSSARNAGIEASLGEYILFFDSDDYVDSKLLETVANYDADLIAFNSSIANNERIIINKDTLQYDFFCGRFTNDLLYSTCSKVFSSNIIKKNNLRFDEKIHIGEDMLFSYEYMSYCTNVQIINNNLYFYDRRDDSAMNNSNKDYLPQYVNTLNALKNKIGDNTFVLSSWCLDVLAIILVRKLFSEMKYENFKQYMRDFEKTEFRNYVVLCTDKKSKAKKLMKFFIKHKMYRLLHCAIKVRV